MRRVKIKILVILYSFLLAAGFSTAAFADEIDDMTKALNEKATVFDAKGFSRLFTEFAVKDKRWSAADIEKTSKTTVSSISSLSAFGKTVSYAPIKKDFCGDRIARTVTVIFTENAQILASYWFFKASDSWALSNFQYTLKGSTSDFVKVLEDNMSLNC